MKLLLQVISTDEEWYYALVGVTPKLRQFAMDRCLLLKRLQVVHPELVCMEYIEGCPSFLEPDDTLKYEGIGDLLEDKGWCMVPDDFEVAPGEQIDVNSCRMCVGSSGEVWWHARLKHSDTGSLETWAWKPGDPQWSTP